MVGLLAGDDFDLDQDILESMELDDVEFSDYFFLGENEDDFYLV